MNKAAAYLLLVASVCAGCSRDAYRNYLGLWERVEEGLGDRGEVIEIKRDGETLLFNDNVLAEKDFFGRPKQPRVMVADQHRAQCSELKAQWEKERAALPQARRGEYELVMAQRNEIDGRYRTKQDKVPDCRFVFMGW